MSRSYPSLGSTTGNVVPATLHRLQSAGQPALGDEHVPGDSAAQVIYTGPQLHLEADAAVIAGWVFDDPRPAQGSCGAGSVTIDIEEFGEVQWNGLVNL